MNELSQNEHSHQPPEQPDDFAGEIGRIARGFAYPPTPDLTAGLFSQPPHKISRGWLPSGLPARIALVLLALVIVFSALLSVPTVRAQILEYLQVGVVRIFFATDIPAPTPTPGENVLPALPGEAAGAPLVVTATPLATAAPQAAATLPGKTTLEQARRALDYELSLPGYPPDLGEPDEVYVLRAGTPVIVLVWLEPDDLQAARLSLYVLPPGNLLAKKQVSSATPTTLNGGEAFWLEEPHPLELYDDQGQPVISRYVSQHVLIWFTDHLTYRLESNLSLAEAIRVAESIP